MKRLTLVLLVLISFLGEMKSQTVWAPDGATWFYNYQSFWNEGYQKIEYINDSVYNGQACKALKRSLHYRDLVSGIDYNNEKDTILTYEENNRVYFYNNTDNQFELLYDFNLVENEYWNITGLNGGCDSYGVQFIDSVKTTDVNGFNLIKQYTQPTDTSEWSLYNIIYERIGSDYVMFPEPLCITYEVVSGLRCYYDDEFGWYHHDETDCDYITGIKNNEIQLGFGIFPNPSNNFFIIKGSRNANVEIYNLTGKLIEQINLQDPETRISTKEFDKGIYLVKVGTETKKLIIE